MKIANNRDEAWNMQNIPEGSHGWIQWKGTNVCMDIYCECGYHGHVDDEFVYFVKCPKCGSVYMTNGHIELIKVNNLTGVHESCIKDISNNDFEGFLDEDSNNQ